MLMMGRLGVFKILMFLIVFQFTITAGTVFSQDAQDEPGQEQQKSFLQEDTTESLTDITVTAQRVDIVPNKTEVFIDDYTISSQPFNVLDVLKDRAMIDFRGQSDLVPESDTFQMRGFDSRQFLMAVDGLVIQRTGGWWGDHNLEFSTVPMTSLDSIEFFYGPHSALYDGKAFGGVINLKTKKPKIYDVPDFEGSMSFSYKSYNTQSQTLSLQGGVDRFNMGVSFERYLTDGYLRNNAAEIESVAGRIGYNLPSDGFIQFSWSYSDLMREIPSSNDPGRSDYDSAYPIVLASDVSTRWQNPSDNCRRDYDGYSLRLDFNQPSNWGTWIVGAYYTDEGQHYNRDGYDYSSYDTNYVSYGGLIKNEFSLSQSHDIVVGMDTAHLYQKYTEQIVETWAGYVQDKWAIAPSLTLTTGLRYEYVTIWWDNWSSDRNDYLDTSRPTKLIEKNYNQLVPKSFLTYELDQWAAWLRDTSLSLGVSKIWTPRDYCEVCSWGSGVEVDPTHGVGYDFVINRRLWNNIFINIDFSHYVFKDYGIWANSATDYFKDSIWGRRMVELEKVYKEGIDLEINGNLSKDLYFYVSYSYNKWTYEGPHNGGPEEWADADLSDRAKHRFNAGLRYNLFKNTMLLLDYKYQDDQVQQVIDIVDDDPSNLEVREVALESYQVFDFAVEQTLFENRYGMKTAKLKLYINNLFDEAYSNSRGYPMTDRTFGAALNFKF